MKFKDTPVAVSMRHAMCDNEGCDGEFVRDTEALGTLATYPPQYSHVCNKCGKTKLFTEVYPKVVYEEKVNKSKKINSFTGKYFFLSNFYEAPVLYNTIKYQNNEAAFQAQKCSNNLDRYKFAEMNPSEAKREGRKVTLRSDWENIKSDTMYHICKAKFMQNRNLLKLLIETGDAELEEGNTWGDKIWGTVDGVGENRLGKILMRVREELKNFES